MTLDFPQKSEQNFYYRQNAWQKILHRISRTNSIVCFIFIIEMCLIL